MLPDVADAGQIDAEQLVARYTVEELSEAAEAYFARVTDRRYHLAKPYAAVDEAPVRLGVFGALLEVLELVPGLTVLDFGAGSCWMSHAFAQLGCAAVACDVSSTALDIGRELFERHPTIGPAPEPRFVVFNGRTMPLDDATVDRIACMDALHHVPNRPEVFSEMFRVLKPGGRVVFAEPGPHHSLDAQSQIEMRNFTVVERDIVMEDIEFEARAAGFRDVQVAIYNPRPTFVDVADFGSVLYEQPERHARGAQLFLQNHRLFVFHKPGPTNIDSRRRWSLRATTTVELFDGRRGTAHIHNTGDAQWLAAGRGIGEVNLGVHLRDEHGRLVDLDFQRIPLPGSNGVASGEHVRVDFQLRELPPGSYQLEFDLVSEGIAWFADNGNRTEVQRVGY